MNWLQGIWSKIKNKKIFVQIDDVFSRLNVQELPSYISHTWVLRDNWKVINTTQNKEICLKQAIAGLLWVKPNKALRCEASSATACTCLYGGKINSWAWRRGNWLWLAGVCVPILSHIQIVSRNLLSRILVQRNYS